MNTRLGSVVMQARDVTLSFGKVTACRNISLSVRAGEVLGIVGESGSGKSTLLRCLSGTIRPDSGEIVIRPSEDTEINIWDVDEPTRIRFSQTSLGLVHQNPRDGLMMSISAGGNIAEPLMAAGANRYEDLRETAEDWMSRVELALDRVDLKPSTFSGGMQKRLQIARCLVTKPRLLFMDEPTGGLDVSVQARLLDLLRSLVRDLGIAVVVVTHDLAVARILAERLLVMRRGEVVEHGLTDQILEDPQHPYTQMLVGAALRI
jgi:putative phosphonate transport system ATP-binding protein